MRKQALPAEEFLSRGYTMVELLVVIAVIGILAGFALTGLSGGQTRETTRSFYLGVRNDLRSMQEQALSSKLNSSGVSACEYGLLLNKISSPQAWSTVRLEPNPPPSTCSATTATTLLTTTGPASGSITMTTVPPDLAYVSFTKNKAAVSFRDSAGSPLSPTPSAVTINFLENLSIISGYTITIYQSTGRIE